MSEVQNNNKILKIFLIFIISISPIICSTYYVVTTRRMTHQNIILNPKQILEQILEQIACVCL